MVETRVLFVDDERMLRDMWSAILRGEGFHVTVAATVSEALSRITSEKFDVLIADLNIGEPVDGFTIVSAMRRIQPEAATLIMTGYPAFQAALHALHQQVDDFLVKPAEAKTVVSMIRRNISRDRKPSQVFTKRLNHVIARNRAEVMDAWYEAVEKHPDIMEIPLSRDERIDHLPQVLDELVRPLDSDRPDLRGSHSPSKEHGAKRRAQGYTIALLLEETRILHGVIADCMQKNLLSIDISNLIPDLIEVHDRMHSLLQTSLEAFLEAGMPRAA